MAKKISKNIHRNINAKQARKQNLVSNRVKVLSGIAFVLIAGVVAVRTFAAQTYFSMSLPTSFTAQDESFVIPTGTTGIKTVTEPSGKKTTTVLEFDKIRQPGQQYAMNPYVRVKLNPGIYRACLNAKYIAPDPTETISGEYPNGYGIVGVWPQRELDDGGKGGLPEALTIRGIYEDFCSYDFKVEQEEYWKLYVSVTGTARLKDLRIQSGSYVNPSLAYLVPPVLYGPYTESKDYTFTGTTRTTEFLNGYNGYVARVAQGGSILYRFNANPQEQYEACFLAKSLTATDAATVSVRDAATQELKTAPIPANQANTVLKRHCVDVPFGAGAGGLKNVRFQSDKGNWSVLELEVKPKQP